MEEKPSTEAFVSVAANVANDAHVGHVQMDDGVLNLIRDAEADRERIDRDFRSAFFGFRDEDTNRIFEKIGSGPETEKVFEEVEAGTKISEKKKSFVKVKKQNINLI